MFSPDGTRLAFVSRRTGNGDIYVLSLRSGAIRRITFDDWFDELSAWSPDGRYLYFSTQSHDISGMTDVYRVPADGGTPLPVSAERYSAEYFGAPAPHNSALALVSKGENWRKWWRRGHSAKDASEIWIREPQPDGPAYRRLTGGGSKDLWPMWSPDGKQIYFVSDRGGNENLWVIPSNGGSARLLTAFRDGRLLWPQISRDGKQIVFERDFAIWKVETDTGKTSPLPITLPGSQTSSANKFDVSRQVEDLVLSPDGERLAFVARGDIFVVPRQGGVASRLTHTAASESRPVWHPGGRRIAYVSERSGAFHLFLYDFDTQRERQLTSSLEGDYLPAWSPDGLHLAFVRGGRAILLLDPERSQERILAPANILRAPLQPHIGQQLAWSPDGRWIAFAGEGSGLFCNVALISIEGGPVRWVSRLANIYVAALWWHPSGSSIFFDTGIDEGYLARVDLMPRAPVFQALTEPKPNNPEDSRRTVGESEFGRGSRAAPVINIEWDGLHRRLSMVPLGMPVMNTHAVSPDGRMLAFVGQAEGQEYLYSYPLDVPRPGTPRRLISSAGARVSVQFSPDGKTLWFIEAGGIQTVDLESGKTQMVPLTATVEVDFDQEKRAVFAQAWLHFASKFYDAGFNGVDWRAARERFGRWVERARSMDDVRRIISLMIGELNVSHLAISSPAFAPSRIGRVGVVLDGNGPDAAGRLRVAEVIGQGPAAIAGLRVGEWITGVDGKTLTPNTNWEELLEGKINQRVVLSVADKDGNMREIAVRSIDIGAERPLLYRDWVEGRRAYVERKSGGKLGYVHIFNMGGATLRQLALDLDAGAHAREGVVVDIRNNYGGRVDGFVLDVLTRRNYQTVQNRAGGRGQQRHVYGQRALGLPTVLVTNSETISDGESLAEGYRQMKAGAVIGEPTAGEVIISGPTTLVDGTGLLLPGHRVLANDGTDMEGHPRPVDIQVERPLGESRKGIDSQLDVAVRHLLSVLRQ